MNFLTKNLWKIIKSTTLNWTKIELSPKIVKNREKSWKNREKSWKWRIFSRQDWSGGRVSGGRGGAGRRWNVLTCKSLICKWDANEMQMSSAMRQWMHFVHLLCWFHQLRQTWHSLKPTNCLNELEIMKWILIEFQVELDENGSLMNKRNADDAMWFAYDMQMRWWRPVTRRHCSGQSAVANRHDYALN